MQAVPGIIESSPGVRSCMIEYDQRVLPLSQLLDTLESIDRELPAVSHPHAYYLDMHKALLPDEAQFCLSLSVRVRAHGGPACKGRHSPVGCLDMRSAHS